MFVLLSCTGGSLPAMAVGRSEVMFNGVSVVKMFWLWARKCWLKYTGMLILL